MSDDNLIGWLAEQIIVNDGGVQPAHRLGETIEIDGAPWIAVSAFADGHVRIVKVPPGETFMSMGRSWNAHDGTHETRLIKPTKQGA